VWCLATAYSCRASEILGVADPWLAYQVDLACMTVGHRVELMTAPDNEGKPRMRVEEALRILSPPELWEERESKPRKFRSVKAYVAQQGAVPESGIW